MNHLPKLLTAVLLFFYSASFASQQTVLLSEAMKRRWVDIVATSAGGALGRCLTLSIRNKTANDMEFKMDDGLIFRPDDTTYQNLVVVGEERLAVKAKETGSVRLWTFCGKSYARGPRTGLNYQFWKKGDTELVSVAKYIREHSLYDYTGQHGIWSITNGHRLSSIYNSSNVEASTEFAKYIASITGRKLPGYNTIHKISTAYSGVVFNPEVEEYVVDISWTTPKPRNMHVTVYKEGGELYREVKEELLKGNEHKVVVKLDPKKDPKGTYLVQLWDDDNNIYRKESVEVE
ncbi:MAG: hypothetical protein EOP49_38075 [Sphingobacteriales bacterium]|nr:MAG: hypothetical protein EOP49_38075 [Sphingobacteriales bacterium]